ncbi:DNA-3-methyladenine glycosylase family protein [Rothia aerolata]|uniref:DNA-3-methyladenine glycosylase family protein n=1 Tax=Rothia aerolata TaxID=1812262 RepID=UPI0016629708|nr:3-methyladenine DNA glycosylase [Rothia aerolata]
MYSATVTVTPPFPVSLGSVVAPWSRGNQDPVARAGAGGAPSFWTSARVGSTPVVLRFEQETRRAAPTAERYLAPIHVRLWAERSAAGLAAIEALSADLDAWVGARDDWSDFLGSPAYAHLPEQLQLAHREHPGLRLGATGQLTWHAISAITEQRVTGIEAMGGLRAVLRRIAEPLPNTGLADQPRGMLFFPVTASFLEVPSWIWHRAGYDSARSRAVLEYARRADSLEKIAQTRSAAELSTALHSISGIGPWTIAEILQRTHGHPDAVSVGDYHLAKHVGWAFEQKRADDARMLQLLAPFTGHRNRVVALIKAARIEAPKHGARLAPQDHRHH